MTEKAVSRGISRGVAAERRVSAISAPYWEEWALGRAQIAISSNAIDDERAAIFEIEAGMPTQWAEAFARLCSSPPPPIYSLEQWRRISDDGLSLWSSWKARIISLGWAPADVRYLLPLLSGRRVTAVGHGGVTVDSGGRREEIYRRPVIGKPAQWQCGRRSG